MTFSRQLSQLAREESNLRAATGLGVTALALLAATAAHIGFRLSRASEPATIAPTASYVTQPGDSVPDVRLLGLQTETEIPLRHVLGDADCRILYFFDPDCPACEVSAAYWNTTSTRELETRVPVAWIGLSPSQNNAYIEAFMDRYGITTPRFVVRRDEVSNLHLTATPQVWGLVGDSVAWSITGAHNTSPDSLIGRLSWCPS